MEVRVGVRLEVAVGNVVLAHLEGRVEVDEGRLHLVVERHPVDLGLRRSQNKSLSDIQLGDFNFPAVIFTNFIAFH